jgi:two-component system phosphate regulon sensor histidine kinase PhoR
MLPNHNSYKKNYLLIALFLVLISISLIIALILGYNFATKNVESSFASQKIEVMEKTLEPYNYLFQTRIPQISFYQGYLDSLSTATYVKHIMNESPFVNKVIFYDSEISNHIENNGFKDGGLCMGIKGLYYFYKIDGEKILTGSRNKFLDDYPLSKNDDFYKLGMKLSNLLEKTDTLKSLSPDLIYKTFYNVSNNRITFMGVPRPDDLVRFSKLKFGLKNRSPIYEQDILSFELDPFKLKIQNIHPELYQFVSLRKISYDPNFEQPNLITTNVNLTGAFADYKMYFASERNFISKEINKRFLPIALGIISIYLILSFIMFLIYRNLRTNLKLFKLQYDFINNFTHEFKTPVSVIKLAGNNIKRAKDLSSAEKDMYGKILDQEADKLNDLMNKLLSFTQLESKSIVLKREKINIALFSKNIIDSFRFKYSDYNIELLLEDTVTIYNDPVLLASIFHNLIENAYKYSESENKYLTIKIQTIKKNVHISFIDKGIGIKSSELDNIFKKFYRIQNQYNQQGSVGLGLAFCKELVVFMNGTIKVTSKIGKGSIFEILLPIQPTLI